VRKSSVLGRDENSRRQSLMYVVYNILLRMATIVCTWVWCQYSWYYHPYIVSGLAAPFPFWRGWPRRSPSESRRGTLRKKSVEIQGENNMYHDRENVLYTHVDQEYVYVIWIRTYSACTYVCMHVIFIYIFIYEYILQKKLKARNICVVKLTSSFHFPVLRVS